MRVLSIMVVLLWLRMSMLWWWCVWPVRILVVICEGILGEVRGVYRDIDGLFDDDRKLIIVCYLNVIFLVYFWN